MTGQKRGRRLAAVAGALTLVTGIGLQTALLVAPPASGEPGSRDTGTDISYTLEGCRGSTADYQAGAYTCPDGSYTTGNLGKGWNELDQVPGRVTVAAGKNHPVAETFHFLVAADASDRGVPGFDQLSTLVPNSRLSDSPGPTVDVSAPQTAAPGVGGADASLYRSVTVGGLQPSATVVLDFTVRPATGSHLYPGSSLHFNLLDLDWTTAGIGARDVSVPVNPTAPVTTTTVAPPTTTTVAPPPTTVATTTTLPAPSTTVGPTTTTVAPPPTTGAPSTTVPVGATTTTQPRTAPSTGTTTTTTAPGTVLVPASPGSSHTTGVTPAAPPSSGQPGVLAFTGSRSARDSYVALGLIGLGTALLLGSQLRRPRRERRL